MTDETMVEAFLAGLKRGMVCLHPTDTVLGLAFDPSHPKGFNHLAELKGRSIEKPCIGMVGSIDQALQVWEPLPDIWQKAITQLWPGSISICWQSRYQWSGLTSFDGSIALRYPDLPQRDRWLIGVCRKLQTPLPTTSVNRSGEPAKTKVDDAIEFCRSNQSRCFVPEPIDVFFSRNPQQTYSRPSTVLRIQPKDRGNFEILREGPVTAQQIQDTLDNLKDN